MNHELLGILRETTEFIESHLTEPLHLDVIADHVCLSKYHLLRIWKSATATGLMEYVRRRRIALSLSDLLQRRFSIDFVADRYGFGCERTYSRVFKDEFGCTPAGWRRTPVALQVLDRFNPEFLAIAGEGLVFLRATLVLPAFSIAGPEHLVSRRENLESQIANRLGNDFFHRRRLEIVNPLERNVYIGLTTHDGVAPGYSRYQPSLLVDRGSIVPDGMRERRIEAHRYGVFAYMGLHRPEEISSKNLSEIWRFVEETWMPTVRFSVKAPFHFERIDYSRCSRQYCECEIHYPIATL